MQSMAHSSKLANYSLYYRERKESINPQLLALKKKKKSPNLPRALCNQQGNFGRALLNQVSNFKGTQA
jgi:hypothetical protein